MSGQDFATYSVESAPAWLRRPQGEAWLLVQGLAKDALVEAARQAVLARVVARAPSDALPLHANDRSLEQAPAESLSAWRTRLDAAWAVWPTAGTNPGILNALAAHGFVGVQLTEARDLEPLSPLWARFWLALPSVPWGFDGDWSDPGTWDDGGVWDTTASVNEITALVRLIRTWKGGHARCVSVTFLMGSDLWDVPPDDWDDGGVWAEGEPSYLYPETYPL